MQTKIFDRVGTRNFNLLNVENSMAQDRNLKFAGIGDLKDEDWKVMLLAVRDLVRTGANRIDEIKKGLVHELLALFVYNLSLFFAISAFKNVNTAS